MDDTPSDWFVREILPHEAALSRYLRRLWPNSADVADIRHDTYIRVYEAAMKDRPRSPKSFLFATARHLMTDRARRNRIVSIDLLEDLGALNVMVDEVSPERRISARQQLMRMTAAFNRIPAKCREVVWLQLDQSTAHRIVFLRLDSAWQQAARLKAVGAGIPPGKVPSPNELQSASFLSSKPAGASIPASPPTSVRSRLLRVAVAASVVLATLIAVLVYRLPRGSAYHTPKLVASKPFQCATGRCGCRVQPL